MTERILATFRHPILKSFLIVLALLVVAGFCYRLTAVTEPTTSTQPHGRHGGHLINLSGNTAIQMELTIDNRRRRMVVYVQDSKTHNPYPLPVDKLNATFETDNQSFEGEFSADPRPSDPKGNSSRFALSLDKIPQQFIGYDRFILKLSYSAGGITNQAILAHDNDHSHNYHHD